MRPLTGPKTVVPEPKTGARDCTINPDIAAQIQRVEGYNPAYADAYDIAEIMRKLLFWGGGEVVVKIGSPQSRGALWHALIGVRGAVVDKDGNLVLTLATPPPPHPENGND